MIMIMSLKRVISVLLTRSVTEQKFRYGESNPELPRRNLIFAVKGGNVSRYTIPDIYFRWDFRDYISKLK